MSTRRNRPRGFAEKSAKQRLLNLERLSAIPGALPRDRLEIRLNSVMSHLDQVGLLSQKSVWHSINRIYEHVLLAQGSVFDQATLQGFSPDQAMIVQVLPKVNNSNDQDHYAQRIVGGQAVEGKRILLDGSKDLPVGSYVLAFPFPEFPHSILSKIYAPINDGAVIDSVFTDADKSSALVVGNFPDLPMRTESSSRYLASFAGAHAALFNESSETLADALGVPLSEIAVLDAYGQKDSFFDALANPKEREFLEKTVLEYLS